MNTAPNTAHLADIHLPEPVAWFPPAPGWWLLAAIGLLSAALVTWLVRRRRQQRAYRRQALDQLQTLAAEPNPHLLAQQLNQLLRRVALHSYPRQQVSQLSGLAWAQWLSQGGHIDLHHARALLEAAYNPRATLTGREQLLEQCRCWIGKHQPAPQGATDV